jgi:hypothetical protein
MKLFFVHPQPQQKHRLPYPSLSEWLWVPSLIVSRFMNCFDNRCLTALVASVSPWYDPGIVKSTSGPRASLAMDGDAPNPPA